MRVLLFAVLSAAFAFTPAVTRAGVWYVAPTGEDGNVGCYQHRYVKGMNLLIR